MLWESKASYFPQCFGAIIQSSLVSPPHRSQSLVLTIPMQTTSNFHMRQNIWYFSYCVWLISLNIVTSRPIHFAINDLMLLVSMAG